MPYFDNHDARWDHDRDLRKHEDFPLRLETVIPMAVEIAKLVRHPSVSLTAAAELIEQYARTKASEAAADAVLETGNRLIAAIETPLSIKDPV
jgi:hypothetical protein